MQRIYTLFLVIVLVASCNNNKENVDVPQISFCNVPLSGNIDDFTNKLAGEGVKLNKDISNSLQEGAKAFDVNIFEWPCMARVEYNPATQNVYEATLMFTKQTTFGDFTAFRDRFHDGIKDKYSNGVFKAEPQLYDYDAQSIAFNDYTGSHFIIHNSKTNDYLGEIYLYWDAKDFDMVSQQGLFMFHVMYRNSEAPSFEQQIQKYY